MMTNLKVLGVVLVTLGLYTWVANVIPQLESVVPVDVSFSGDVTTEQLVAAGEDLFTGGAGCTTCHGLVTRAPNIRSDFNGEGTIGQRCASRVAGQDCKTYLYESITDPGYHLGRKRAVVLIENNGLFDAGNALRWVCDSKFPLVLMVGYLSYRFMSDTPDGRIWNDDYWPGVRDLTEPFIDAFQVPHQMLASDDDTKRIPEAFAEAERREGPVILLLTTADDYVAGT